MYGAHASERTRLAARNEANVTLVEFLTRNRVQILALSEAKVVSLAALRPSSPEMRVGLPTFFDQLIAVLKKNSAKVSVHDEEAILESAAFHGKELLHLGYTLSHVVHAYGAICQAVTQLASDLHAPVTALEFHNLNRCLDIAIAGAVTEFESGRNLEAKDCEVVSLGTFVHELRNALNRATIASQMIMKGIVGAGGSTSKVLQFSLMEMQRLIDRSLSEVRLRAETEAQNDRFFVSEFINQLVVTAEVEASMKQLTLGLDLDPNIELETDRHLLLSAVGNLLQNAMKFTKPQTGVALVVKAVGEEVIIEVSDHCGGIPAEKMEKLFLPFTQAGNDRSGLGLGLAIARRAVEKCGGTLGAHNADGGCVFRITLPRAPKSHTGALPPVL